LVGPHVRNPRHGVYLYGDVLVPVNLRAAHSGQGSDLGPGGAPQIARLEQDALEHMLEETCGFKRYSSFPGPVGAHGRAAEGGAAAARQGSKVVGDPAAYRCRRGPYSPPQWYGAGPAGLRPGNRPAFDPGEVEFPAVPEWPMRDDALAALEKFTDLLTRLSFRR